MTTTEISPVEYLDRIRDSANRSAQLYRTVFIGFLILAAYSTAIALSVTDELLFLNGNLTAPVINIDISVSYFFHFMPWLLLTVHFTMILQAIILTRKASTYQTILRRHQIYSGNQPVVELSGTLFPIPILQATLSSQYSSGFRQLLVLFVFATMVVIPLASLAFLQVRYLPSQSATSYIHWSVIGIDVALVVHYWPEIYYFMKNKDTNFLDNRSIVRDQMKKLRQLVAIFLLILLLCSDFTAAQWPPRSYHNTESGGASSRYRSPEAGPIDAIRKHIGIRNTLVVRNRRLYSEVHLSPKEVCILNSDDDMRTITELDDDRSFVGADLSGSFLCFVSLPGVNFENADLSGAVLHGANLSGGTFVKSDFSRAKLNGAVLSGGNFVDAELVETDLRGATLVGERDKQMIERAISLGFVPDEMYGGFGPPEVARTATFEEANLRSAKLQGTVLVNANFRNANLEAAELQGSILWNARLDQATASRATLYGASLALAKLRGANLIDAKLQGANLRKTDLRGAHLSSAKLHGAVLNGARMQGANLTRAEFQGAKFEGAHCHGIESSGYELSDTLQPSSLGSQLYARVDRETDVSGAYFVDGLSSEDVDEVSSEMRLAGLSREVEGFMGRVSMHVNNVRKLGVMPSDWGCEIGFV